MRQGEQVFVDTDAWIALALTRDPLHDRASEIWLSIKDDGLKLRTSVPVVLETFTFLERNAMRDVALAWKDSLSKLSRLKTLECRPKDLSRPVLALLRTPRFAQALSDRRYELRYHEPRENPYCVQL